MRNTALRKTIRACLGKTTLALGLVGAVLFAALPEARAQMGGLGLYEVGGSGTGNANAGFSANAMDASIAYFNPAAMTQLKGHHFLAGLQVLYADLTFRPGPLSDIAGSDGGNAGGFVPSGGLYFVYSATERVKLGLSINAPWAAKVAYDSDWVGRYHITSKSLVGINFNPSVGVRLAKWVSLGLGVQVHRFDVNKRLSFNTTGAGVSPVDGHAEVEGGAWSAAVLAGTTFEPDADTTIGITYRSPTPVDINGKATFSSYGPIGSAIPGPQALELSFTMPMAVSVGLKRDFFEKKFSLLFDAGWANSSAFSENSVTLGGVVSGKIDRNFHDTWRVAAGFHYWALPNWLLQTGYSFDSSPVPDASRTPDLPTGAMHRVALGTQVDVNPLVRIGFHYSLGIAGDMAMDAPPTVPWSGRVQGEYNNTFYHFFLTTIALHWGAPAAS